MPQRAPGHIFESADLVRWHFSSPAIQGDITQTDIVVLVAVVVENAIGMIRDIEPVQDLRQGTFRLDDQIFIFDFQVLAGMLFAEVDPPLYDLAPPRRDRLPYRPGAGKA